MTAPTQPTHGAPTPAKPPFRVADLRRIFGASGRQFGILGALVAIVIFFQVLTGGKTLDPINLLNLVNGNA